MKKLRTLFLTLLVLIQTNVLFSQDIFTENFDDGTMPPTGWYIDDAEVNWMSVDLNRSGGTHPEARYTSQNDYLFEGTSRLISPEIDLSGINKIVVEYDQSLVVFFGQETSCGLATQSDGGTWNVVLENNATTPFEAKHEIITIENEDIGSDSFRFCFFVNQAGFYMIHEWNIDQIKIYTAQDHDVGITNCLNEQQYQAGNSINPEIEVVNCGNSEESINLECKIYDSDDNLVFNDTYTVNNVLPDENQSVCFDAATLNNANELFRMEFKTEISNDGNPENNTKEVYLNTYSQYLEEVILEVGTGTWCGFCPGIAMGADDLVKNGHNVAVVEYHRSDDYANSYSNSRINYYNISFYPSSFFNSKNTGLGGDTDSSMYEDLLPHYEAANTKKTPFNLELYGVEINPDFYKINVDISRNAPIAYENLTVVVAVTESHIPESWQNQDELNYTLRTMLGGANGTPIDLISNTVEEIELPLSLDDDWVLENLEIVVFVQDPYTQEIFQGTKQMLTDLPTFNRFPKASNLDAQIYPNPFNEKINIIFSLQKEQSINISIYDLQGNNLYSSTFPDLIAGNHAIEIKNLKYLPHVSICKITGSCSQKVIKLINIEE